MLPALGLNVTGVVVSSLCFGILHISGFQHWPYSLGNRWATAGVYALATGNLLVLIVAHIFTNLVSSCF